MLRYMQAVWLLAAQGAACNRLHPMEERCARWLLMTQDRAMTDAFPMTHELLSYMLGTRRATVTMAAGILQHAGLIRYARGCVTVLNGPAWKGRRVNATPSCGPRWMGWSPSSARLGRSTREPSWPRSPAHGAGGGSLNSPRARQQGVDAAVAGPRS